MGSESLENILLLKNFTIEEISTAVAAWDSGMKLVISSQNETLENPTWTFFNAAVFSFDITSKIGYGNVVPATLIGQIICVIYAFLGIPISILFCEALGDSFTNAYVKTIWLVPTDETGLAGRALAGSAFFALWTVVLIVLPSIVFMFTEEWSFLDGIYYTVVTVTTVGIGDYIAGLLVKFI
ncbi:potassium channel subfamily K member 16-like [Parasteatoda tepidariorum]|uniref:potassium channel subfamily K member 16-like n=1 Tax=Parasteatoda tepidariorum TaxID=114398 RepID=UPI001C72579F|nr:potassium channel subfamily K member 16-like [Parasteatoda tepidariorum]